MARKRTAEQNAQARENYRRLLEAGFKREEATRLRWASKEKVARALATKQAPPPVEAKAVRRGKTKEWIRKHPPETRVYKRRERMPGRAPAGWPPLKEKPIRGPLQYQLVQPPLTYAYLSRYTYVVSYVTKDKNGNYERKYAAITSERRMSKKQLLETFMRDYIGQPANRSQYAGASVLKTSVEVIGAYVRPEALGA